MGVVRKEFGIGNKPLFFVNSGFCGIKKPPIFGGTICYVVGI